MATISGASLSPILNRLNAVDNYHPLSAETFSDWATEAGDIVTVTRDGKTYNSPVHSMTMTWKGTTPQTTINSTGKQKRDPISKVSSRKYRSGGGGVRQSGKFYNYEVNQEHLLYEIYDTNGRYSGFEVTIEGLYHEVYDSTGRLSRLQNTADGLYHEVYDSTGRVSVLQDTADGLYHEVYDPNTGLDARIQTQAGKIGLVVGTGADGDYIKAGEITLAINNAGESEAHIDANKVYIGNQKSTTVINGKAVLSDVTADYINTKIQTLATLNANNISCNTITAGTNIYGPNGLSLWANGLWNVTLTGPTNNVYTLKKTTLNGTETKIGTFSRATTLSGAWSGRNYTVTASPQGETKTGIVYDGIVSTGNVTKSGKNVSQEFIVYSDNGEGDADSVIMRKTLTISASSVYTDGYNDGRPISGTAGGRTAGVTSLVHDFTITKGDGTTTTLQINCSSIYTTARTGYTLGTFTAASVTLQGRSETVYIVPSSGGTSYYKAGTATIYYKSGSSSTFNLRSGSALKLKKWGTGTLYSAPNAGTSQGNHTWYYLDTTNGTAYYLSGGSSTVTLQGSSVSVTPISGSALKLSSTIRYKAGTTYTNTYYTKS